MTNSFNLVHIPWIPVSDIGKVSLLDIFERDDISTLIGTPIEKIAILKLLLSIAQAANTPDREQDWVSIGSDGLANACVQYLKKWENKFFLYGDQPFLQMPEVIKGKIKPYGLLRPDISTGNNTVVNKSQVERDMDDSEKAMLLICQMGFSLSGKKVDNSVILSDGYTGKSTSGKVGSSMGFIGFLHNFVIGHSIKETVWMNLFTKEDIKSLNRFKEGVGVPPWEAMPKGESCPVALSLINSFQGRLVPMGRFCFLTDAGVHITEGINHPGYKDGQYDPSIAISFKGKDPKALWSRPDKKPWRELTSLLSFIDANSVSGFQCDQLFVSVGRIRNHMNEFAIWSAGVKVSSNAGEQYLTGGDDYVESTIWLDSEILGTTWFMNLSNEVSSLSDAGKKLYGSVIKYFKEINADGGKHAEKATQNFWQYCEKDFQKLLFNLGEDSESIAYRDQQRIRYAGYANKAFNLCCPNTTARQIDAWAKSRPNLKTYLNKEVKQS
jgi:CRISPR system Cascade subunit CasA